MKDGNTEIYYSSLSAQLLQRDNVLIDIVLSGRCRISSTFRCCDIHIPFIFYFNIHILRVFSIVRIKNTKAAGSNNPSRGSKHWIRGFGNTPKQRDTQSHATSKKEWTNHLINHKHQSQWQYECSQSANWVHKERTKQRNMLMHRHNHHTMNSVYHISWQSRNCVRKDPRIQDMWLISKRLDGAFRM